MQSMKIVKGWLEHPQVIALLTAHAARARAETERGSAHALDAAALRGPEVTLLTAWSESLLLGVGALRRIDSRHGEIKSMHTIESARRRGVGSAILRELLREARTWGMTRVSLETGSWDYFAPARALYRAHGFQECDPFAEYRPDPNSVFLTLELAPLAPIVVCIEDPAAADARWCLEQYFAELRARFPGGYEPAVDGTPSREFAAPSGWLVIARREGVPLACGALKRSGDQAGEIKRLWVDGKARRQGLARRVLAELERIAQDNGLRTVRLDTHSALAEARALYGACGYREIPPFNSNPYAHHWFEKTLTAPVC